MKNGSIFCIFAVQNLSTMIEKSVYQEYLEPHGVDFTLHATIASLGEVILNRAGEDAHRHGFGIDVLFPQNLTWVLSRMSMEFEWRPEQYSHYKLETWVSDYNRILSTRNFVLSDEQGEVFGHAVTQWTMIDMKKRSFVDLTDVCEAHNTAIVDEPSPIERPRKIRNVSPTRYTQHQVVYTDIDFNRHVNTMRYIEMMLNMLPLERLTEQRPVRVDVHFLHESHYGQVLTIGLEEREGSDWFEVKAEDGTPCVRASFEWK